MSCVEHPASGHGAAFELCAHVLQDHEALRATVRRIDALLDEVVEAHGDERLDLCVLQRAFGQFRAELEQHLVGEDELLLPACTTLGPQGGERVDEALLAAGARDHASIGIGLVFLRLLADDYDPGHAVCATHRTLLDALAAFVLELHRQIHEEDEGLVPQVREWHNLRGTPIVEAPKRESLPRCCRTWVAEQTRTWPRR